MLYTFYTPQESLSEKIYKDVNTKVLFLFFYEKVKLEKENGKMTKIKLNN